MDKGTIVFALIMAGLVALMAYSYRPGPDGPDPQTIERTLRNLSK